MRTVPYILTLLTLALFAAGCGDSGDDKGDSASTTPTTQKQTPAATQPATTEATPSTTTTPAGPGAADSATPARAKEFEDCVKGNGRDIGGLNTRITDTGFIVDVVVAQVYLFDSPAKATAKKAEVADDNSGDKVVVKGDTVTAYDSIQPDDQVAKTQSLVESCV